jgi:Leucine-rich repeat (LRR) protein
MTFFLLVVALVASMPHQFVDSNHDLTRHYRGFDSDLCSDKMTCAENIGLACSETSSCNNGGKCFCNDTNTKWSDCSNSCVLTNVTENCTESRSCYTQQNLIDYLSSVDNGTNSTDRSIIDLAKKKIYCFENGTFDSISTNFSSTKILRIYNNKLKSLGQNLFECLPNLESLEIYQNYKITLTSPNTFKGLGKLEYLLLFECACSTLDNDIFQPLSSVIHISLEYNNIKVINARFFANLVSLVKLEMNNNLISSVYWNAFSWLKNLRYLSLAFNKLFALDTRTFEKLINLEYLYLENNCIYSLEPLHFLFLTNLKELLFQYNQISSLNANQFSNLGKLEALYCNDNGIASLDLTCFVGLSNLVTLNMANNLISDVDVTQFNNMGPLTSLVLNNNPFVTIPSLTFCNIGNTANCKVMLMGIPEEIKSTASGLCNGCNCQIEI